MTREQLRKHVTAAAVWLGLWNAWVAVQAVVLVAWATSPARSSSGLWWALAPSWGPLALAAGIVALIATAYFLVALLIWAWGRRRGPPVEVVKTSDPPPEGTPPN